MNSKNIVLTLTPLFRSSVKIEPKFTLPRRYESYRSSFYLTWDTSLTGRLFILPWIQVLLFVFSSYLRYQFYRSSFHLTWDTSFTGRLFILPEIPVLQVVFLSYLRHQSYRSSFHLFPGEQKFSYLLWLEVLYYNKSLGNTNFKS